MLLFNFVFSGLTKVLLRVSCTPQQLRLSTNVLIKLMKLKHCPKIMKLASVVCYFAFHSTKARSLMNRECLDDEESPPCLNCRDSFDKS